MNAPLFFLIFAVVAASSCGVLWLGWRHLDRDRKKHVRERLRTADPNLPPEAVSVTILQEDQEKSWKLRFELWALSQVEAAGLKWNAPKVYVVCASCAVAGSVLGLRASRALPHGFTGFASILPLLFATLPFLYLSRKRRKRLALIEVQLPDALEFLARSLRIGNSFLMSLELLVDESEEPLRGEFLRLTGEIRLGSPIAEPMQKLLRRVPLLDLRMFVSAVLLQRETGGNLGILLTRIAASIRDRFRVRGQVDAAASQAKLSARVLSAMPFVVLGGILLLSPGYLKIMTDEPLGRKLLIAAALGQMLGFFIMRNIVRIKV